MNATGLRLLRILFVFFTMIGISACAGIKALDRQQDATLDEYHTTCLKRGLAADTNAHLDCVIALYEAQGQHLARLRAITAPVEIGNGTTGDDIWQVSIY